MRTVVKFMPARRHNLDSDERLLQCGVRVAIADLAAHKALCREEDLEPAQAACLTRKGVEGLEILLLGKRRAAAPGVQGKAKLCWSLSGLAQLLLYFVLGVDRRVSVCADSPRS